MLNWPSDKDLIEHMYTPSIELLFETFAAFFEPNEELDMVLEQFNDLQGLRLAEPGLNTLKFHEFWSRMLVFRLGEFPLILRLVAITMVIPVDTSECERVFSLMNDIKTTERCRLGSSLKYIMLWHRLACKKGEDGSLSPEHLTCAELPVMGIIKKWREMAGPRGRTAHRALQGGLPAVV